MLCGNRQNKEWPASFCADDGDIDGSTYTEKWYQQSQCQINDSNWKQWSKHQQSQHYRQRMEYSATTLNHTFHLTRGNLCCLNDDCKLNSKFHTERGRTGKEVQGRRFFRKKWGWHPQLPLPGDTNASGATDLFSYNNLSLFATIVAVNNTQLQ